jgi:hypothetical protein
VDFALFLDRTKATFRRPPVSQILLSIRNIAGSLPSRQGMFFSSQKRYCMELFRGPLITSGALAYIVSRLRAAHTAADTAPTGLNHLWRG